MEAFPEVALQLCVHETDRVGDTAVQVVKLWTALFLKSSAVRGNSSAAAEVLTCHASVHMCRATASGWLSWRMNMAESSVQAHTKRARDCCTSSVGRLSLSAVKAAAMRMSD